MAFHKAHHFNLWKWFLQLVHCPFSSMMYFNSNQCFSTIFINVAIKRSTMIWSSTSIIDNQPMYQMSKTSNELHANCQIRDLNPIVFFLDRFRLRRCDITEMYKFLPIFGTEPSLRFLFQPFVGVGYIQKIDGIQIFEDVLETVIVDVIDGCCVGRIRVGLLIWIWCNSTFLLFGVRLTFVFRDTSSFWSRCLNWKLKM